MLDLENLDVKGRRVLVTGVMGKTGRAMADLLVDLGAEVYGTDRASEGSLEGIVDLRPDEDPALLSRHNIEAVFVSPGIPLVHPLFVEARRLGLAMLGDLDLGFLYLKQHSKDRRLIAVTGTDGKSTTTAMIGHILRDAGIKALECGNYGLPFSAAVRQPATVYVCECSSYQLEDLQFFRPDVGMLLNIAADHMDRYSGMDAYLRAKLRLFALQSAEDCAIIGPDLKKACQQLGIPDEEFPGRLQAELIEIQEEWPTARLGGAEMPWSALPVNSATNRKNAMMALAGIEALLKKGLPDCEPTPGLYERLLQGLKAFRGLPHRQEVVAEREGILFVNDSKATTVHAALSAVASFSGKKIYLLLGGLDKNADFSVLRETPALRIYPFGKAAEKIAAQTGVSRRFAGLEEAFFEALRDARRSTAYFAGATESDAVILLSPACASQDAYANYEERGIHFRRLALP